MWRNLIVFILLLTSCSYGALKPDPLEPGQLPQESPLKQSKTKHIKPAVIEHSLDLKVAFIIPTSGSSKTLGNAILDAAQLALMNKSVKLYIIDENQPSDQLQQQLQHHLNNGVQLIIGPLYTVNTKVVKPLALAKNIPILSFSNNPTIARDNLFILGYSPDEQVKLVLDYATKHKVKYFYALFPTGQYGNHAYDIFRSVLTPEIATIMKVESYNNLDQLELAAKNIATQIKHQLASSVIEDKTIGIFIPEGGATLEKLLAHFQSHELDFAKFRFLGTGQWDDHETFANRLLNSAWFPGVLNQNRQNLEENFFKYFQYPMPRIASLGYEAILIAALLDTQHLKFITPQSILNLRNVSAGDDSIEFNHTNIIAHRLNIIEINDGSLSLPNNH